MQFKHFYSLFILVGLFAKFIYSEEEIELKPWEEWWEKNYDSRLHDFRSFWGDENATARVNLRQYLKKMGYKSTLDIPCGLGQDYFGLKKENIDIKYAGIDITPKIVKFGLESGLPVQQANIDAIPYKDNAFDIVYSRHIFEHLDYYEDAINEIIRVAQKEAMVVFFIIPSEKQDSIDLVDYYDGTLLFHNHYNKERLEKFVLTNKKVKKIEWEIISSQESALHIYLKDSDKKEDVKILPYMDTGAVLNFIKPHLPENPVIVEAGAYNGRETLLINKFWPKSLIYAFEPVPKIYIELSENTKDCDNIKRYLYALSDKNGTAKFHLSEDPSYPGIPTQSGSLLPAKEHLKYHFFVFNNEICVQTITLDNWAKKNNVKSVDLLWYDMQGHELSVLKASPEILKTVKAIYVEAEFVEAYAGQALFGELKEWLESNGFRFAANNVADHVKENKWFCKAIFIKK